MLQCWPVVRRTVEVLTKVVVYWRSPKLISIKNSKSYISWTCWLCLLTTLCAFRHNVHVKQNLVYNSYLSIPFATSRLWRDQALLSGPCFDGMALLAFLLSVVSIRVLRSKWAVHGPSPLRSPATAQWWLGEVLYLCSIWICTVFYQKQLYVDSSWLLIPALHIIVLWHSKIELPLLGGCNM